MTATGLHLKYLCQILEANTDDPTGQLADDIVSDFFDAISRASIATNGRSWKKKPVFGLLWHLNDLLPAARQAVESYVLTQWRSHTANQAPATSRTAADTPSPPSESLASSPAAHDSPKIVVEPSAMDEPQVSPAEPIWRPTREPDWFDRFTDWIAAVVSLFKQ